MSNNCRLAAFSLLVCTAALSVACAPDTANDNDRSAFAEITVPAGPDSLAPKLASAADGSPVLSWIDRDDGQDYLRFARWSDGGWSVAETVSSGDNWFVNWADFPSVVPVSDRLWGAHWLAHRPAGGYAYDAFGAISTDGGRSWSDGFTLHSDNTDTEHGFVTLYRKPEGVGAVWLDGRKMVNDVEPDPTSSGMTLRAATISPAAKLQDEAVVDELVCDCCQTDVALSGEVPVAVYRDRSVDEVRDIYVARFEDGAWQPGIAVNNDGWTIHGCPVNGPTIIANADELAVAWFTTVDDTPRVRLARSRDGGHSFSRAIDVITGSTLGRVAAAFLPDGSIAVAWLAAAEGGTNDLLMRSVSATGDTGPVRVLAKSVASFSFPQVLSVGDALLFAWTHKDGERTQVRSALIAAIPVS